jgi:hypothetical protein
VLGAAVKMPVDKVRIFIESLRGTGFAGDVALLVRPNQRELKAYLARHGARTFHSLSTRRLHGPIHAYRFRRFADYLGEHGDRYDQVLVSDVRDVAFQKHPFDGISSPACHFFLESANETIGSEPYNRRWSRMFLRPEEAETIAACRISCCGVTLGGSAAMTRYLECLVAAMQSLPWRQRLRIGADTAIHNRMAHLTHEAAAVLVENNRHVATMGLEPESAYRVDDLGQIRLPDGHVPAILHQYDRNAALRAAIEARYPR